MRIVVLFGLLLGIVALAGAWPSILSLNEDIDDGGELLDDIILSPAQRAAIDSHHKQQEEETRGLNDTSKRKALDFSKYNAMLWPNKKIPYSIDSSLGDDSSKKIFTAIKHWMESTCLNFVSRTGEEAYIKFVETTGAGCGSSDIGRGQEEKMQTINLKLSSSCLTALFGSTVHEIGHAIGLVHEQCRQDRDQYITINKDNIQDGMEGNFDLLPTNNHGVPYDYESVMQYPATAFGKNGAITMEAKDKSITKLGQKYGLSARDIELVYAMYCPTDVSCYMKTDGSDYRGKQAKTATNKPCQNWKSHRGSYTDENYILGGLGDHKYCRTPTPKDLSPLKSPVMKPWCYTSSAESSKEYCNVGQPKNCQTDRPNDPECYSDPRGADYRGNKNTVQVEGVTTNCVARNPYGMQKGYDKCRNLQATAYQGSWWGSYRPWCYTGSGVFVAVWKYCDVGDPYNPCW